MRSIIEKTLKEVDLSELPFQCSDLVDIFTQRLSELPSLPFKQGERLTVRVMETEEENRCLALVFTPTYEAGYRVCVYIVFNSPEKPLDRDHVFPEMFPEMLVTNAGLWRLQRNHIPGKEPSFTHLSYWELFEKILLRIDRGILKEGLVKEFQRFKNIETTAARFSIHPDDKDDGFLASYDNLVMVSTDQHPQLDQTYLGLRFDLLN